MPPGKDIDHSKGLNGTMAAYAEQVLVCTGKEDWMSKIEEENSGDNLAADIKELVGRGGVYTDVSRTLGLKSSVFQYVAVLICVLNSRIIILLSSIPLFQALSRRGRKSRRLPHTSYPLSNTYLSFLEYLSTLYRL